MSRARGRPPGLIPDGDKIRRIRVRVHGVTAADIAARIGCHPEHLYKIEGNRCRIGEVLAARLARALGVEVEDITNSPPEALAS